MKRGTSIALVVVALLFAASPGWAGDKTTGTVSIETKSVAAGVGVTWGEGMLEYRGQRYPFTVTGFSIGDVGVSKWSARGEVYNLKDVTEFEGTFIAGVAAMTIGGGGGAAALQSEDVSMLLRGTTQGVGFALAQGGLTVKMADTPQYQAAKAARNAPAAAPRASQ